MPGTRPEKEHPPQRRRHTQRGRSPQRWRAAHRRFEESGPGRLWGRLSAVDLFAHSFQLAALALLCFFPFLIIITAAAGRDAAVVVTEWLGLNQQAARAVASLFKPATGSYALTATSALFLLLGALAVAGTLQTWYRMLFDVRGGGWRTNAAQLAWLAGLLGYAAVQSAFGRAFGGTPLPGLMGFLWSLVFWWASMYVLLVGAVPWRVLFPPALVTSLCWTGLGVFSAHWFSATIVANQQKYGPIGVVMVILSWLVAVGVVIHLGAVVGRMTSGTLTARKDGGGDGGQRVHGDGGHSGREAREDGE
ncbi:YihY/virulence factor BrkB family protein [Streptomyces cyanogenus]|uniref:Ribonuclease BN-like family protein n=1 Tax=Streptomyces cyanogenus TaxID=80860 RepID=A0ABX7TM24_STRCY|nr:YihY/virulence factor BrkB family protein [Streptomyces cyanogenus]QTD96643.1 Ribonuclease BN-like family protein [Streptomyces cyanogenus]